MPLIRVYDLRAVFRMRCGFLNSGPLFVLDAFTKLTFRVPAKNQMFDTLSGLRIPYRAKSGKLGKCRSACRDRFTCIGGSGTRRDRDPTAVEQLAQTGHEVAHKN